VVGRFNYWLAIAAGALGLFALTVFNNIFNGDAT
jgi:hypothetical protein